MIIALVLHAVKWLMFLHTLIFLGLGWIFRVCRSQGWQHVCITRREDFSSDVSDTSLTNSMD